MLKVLHVMGKYLPDNGGTIQRVRNLLLPLVRRGLCEIHLIAPKQGFNEKRSLLNSKLSNKEIIEGIIVHRVEKFSHLFRATNKISQKYNINLIHTHNPRLDLFCYTSRIKKPIISEIHTIRELNLIKFKLTKFAYQRAIKIICLSEKMKEEIMRKYQISDKRIEVIYNGVDTSQINLKMEECDDIRMKYHIQEEFIIGYIGTFYQWQGVRDLVKAFSFLLNKREDAHLLLVGNGPDLNFINKLIYEYGLKKKVTITGMISSEKIYDYYKAIDVFIIPRPSTIETETAVPLKVFESMAAHKTIIATRVGGLSEVIEDGVNGILVSPGNPEELGQSIHQLLINKNLRIRLSENAYKTVKDKFQWENSSKKLFNLYENCINSYKQNY